MKGNHINTRPRFDSHSSGLRPCRFKRFRLGGSSGACGSLLPAVQHFPRFVLSLSCGSYGGFCFGWCSSYGPVLVVSSLLAVRTVHVLGQSGAVPVNRVRFTRFRFCLQRLNGGGMGAPRGRRVAPRRISLYIICIYIYVERVIFATSF